MTSALYDAFRAAGVDLLRAHRLDPTCRRWGPGGHRRVARTMQGDDADLERLRAALVADLDGIVAGLALLDGATRLART